MSKRVTGLFAVATLSLAAVLMVAAVGCKQGEPAKPKTDQETKASDSVLRKAGETIKDQTGKAAEAVSERTGQAVENAKEATAPRTKKANEDAKAIIGGLEEIQRFVKEKQETKPTEAPSDAPKGPPAE